MSDETKPSISEIKTLLAKICLGSELAKQIDTDRVVCARFIGGTFVTGPMAEKGHVIVGSDPAVTQTYDRWKQLRPYHTMTDLSDGERGRPICDLNGQIMGWEAPNIPEPQPIPVSTPEQRARIEQIAQVDRWNEKIAKAGFNLETPARTLGLVGYCDNCKSDQIIQSIEHWAIRGLLPKTEALCGCCVEGARKSAKAGIQMHQPAVSEDDLGTVECSHCHTRSIKHADQIYERPCRGCGRSGTKIIGMPAKMVEEISAERRCRGCDSDKLDLVDRRPEGNVLYWCPNCKWNIRDRFLEL